MRFSNFHLRYLAAVTLAATLTTHIHAEPREIQLRPEQVYTNVPSQFQFPPIVATLVRMPTFKQYDAGGRDIGVGYNDLPNGIAATVFVYPITERPPNNKLESHFEVCKSEVFKKHAGTKLLSEGKIQITTSGRQRNGLHSTFANTEVFAKHRQSVRSEIYLFTLRNSFLLYRLTYPAANQATAEPAVKAFMGALAWPETP